MPSFTSETRNGVQIHLYPTDKYKMNTIVLSFLMDIKEGEATANAIIPHLLMRGSQLFPTSEQIQTRLADLYGASLSVGVGKKGETQLLQFVCKVANEKYVGEPESLLEQAMALMADVVLRPQTEQGAFLQKYTEQEKDQHRKRIESITDDKIAYAAERCQEVMTDGERFAIPRLGRVEDLAQWDAKSLFEHYQKVIATAPVHIHIVGHVDTEETFRLVEQIFQIPRKGEQTIAATEVISKVEEVREVIDQMDVTQGKLNLGLRTGGISYKDLQYPALILYNAILGGFPHSKLFVNVREKESLAYYASSRLEPFKGVMFIQSGIEVDKYERALEIMKVQLETMKQGDISETEMSYSINGLINQYRTALDLAESLADVHLGGIVSGIYRPLEEQIEAISQVTKEDVVQVAQQVNLDTIYFLRNKEVTAHA